MSFKLGAFDTDDITDFKAILQEWPVLPVDLQLDELPAGDGSLFYRARMTETEWVFNLELTGTDIADVMAKADAISLALNPKMHGEQDFTPNAMGDFVWKGVLSRPINWERDKVIWFSDQGICRLQGQATVATPNPYGVSAETPVVLPGPGNLVLVGGGNTTFYPIVEIRGTLTAGQSLSVSDPTDPFGNALDFQGPLANYETLVLDFGEMDFYTKVTANGNKLRNVADKFNSFVRFEGQGSLTLSVFPAGGTVTNVVGRVPSRRI